MRTGKPAPDGQRDGQSRQSLGRVQAGRGIHGNVVDLLGVDIVGGRWQPGDSLPTEAAFMDELGVSRTVVREAFRVLRAKGMVESRPMAGSRVLPRSNWRLLDPDVLQWRINSDDRVALLRDLMQLRLIFEPTATRAATELADDKARARARDAWQTMLASTESRDAFIDADVVLHAALLRAAGNELLEQLFTIIEAAQRLLLDVQMTAAQVPFRKDMLKRTLELHRRVVEAFLARDAAGAEAAMRGVIEAAIHDANMGLRLIEQSGVKTAV